MTTPTRLSAGTRIARAWSAVLTVIVGLALFAFGGFFLVLEMKTPSTAHPSHVFLFAGIAIVGALVIRPDPIFAVIKQAFIIAGPYIPQLKFGSRAEDVPAPPGVKPGTPVPPASPPNNPPGGTVG